MFEFGEPQWFMHLIWLLPVAVGGFFLYRSGRKRRISRFGQPDTVAALAPEASPRRVRFKFLLWLAALLLLVTALARPRYGSKLKEVDLEGMEIMLVVDVSNSMLAEDMAPNRLARTKNAIDRLIEELDADRIGLTVFAGDAYVVLPITSDYTAARNFLKSLSPSMVSKQGTAMGAAIETAALAFSPGSEGSRVMIVISDGENHEDDPVAAARAASQMGITVHTIGVGTPEGAPIFLNGDYIRDENGNMVVTRLDETLLEQAASVTGGVYVRATHRSIGLVEIMERVRETERTHIRATVFDEYNELFPYFLGFALSLLFFDLFVIPRKNRLLARFDVFGNKNRLSV